MSLPPGTPIHHPDGLCPVEGLGGCATVLAHGFGSLTGC